MSGNRKRRLPITAPGLTIEPKFIRKRGSRDSCTSGEQQFPAAQKATDLTISTCTGYLTGDGVIVSDLQDIGALLKLGNYGKGVFSRSVPCHGELASFKLPFNMSDRRKKRVSDDGGNKDIPPSQELTFIEQDLLQKMSQLVEVQERRIQLHAEWSREAMQDETKTSSTSGQIELGPINSQVTQTGPKLQLQENSSDKTLHSLTPSQQSTDVASSDGGELETSSLRLEPFKHLEKKLNFLSETDQYKLFEYLQLGSEEAFYLSHKLNLLNVISDYCKRTLSVDELWDCLCSGNSNFIARYVAYCYYREKGWVPKSGLKFGVDFVLYKQGPVTYHSSYTVVVRMTSEGEETTQVGKQDSKTRQTGYDTVNTSLNSKTGLTWRDVIALERVSKSVVKDLIVCCIVTKQHLADEDWKQFPGCLEKLRVSEVFVKQWQPDREREAS